MLPMQRRMFLKKSLGATALAAASVLVPRAVLAAWNEAAFSAKSIDAGLTAALGQSALEESDQVVITVPDAAENGAVVPVTVSSTLADTESIVLLFDKNASPVCSIARLGQGIKPSIGLRIKMGESGKVVGVVKAGGKLYSASKQVKVTTGGCA